jgi:hypothetical protein
MSVCQRCIIPDSHPNVTLDGEGICSLCRIHDGSPRLKKPAAGKDALVQVLTSKRSGEYDCVVPLSGGKDSSYALFYVVRELGLKPLAVFADSGLVVDLAKKNIERICDQLSVDLVVHQARFRRRLAQEALYISKYGGIYYPICPPCETNNRSVVIQEATKRRIPYIVWGASDFEDDALTFLDLGSPTMRQRYGGKVDPVEMTPRGLVRRVLQVTGLSILYQMLKLSIPWHRKLKVIPHALMYLYFTVRNNLDVDVPEGWRKYLPTVQVSFEGKSVETIYLYDYVPYDPYTFVETLKKELGWQAPDGKESRMDCKMFALESYKHLERTGVSKDGFTFSVLIRYGLMARAEAKRKEEAIARGLLENSERLLEELGVDKQGILP